MKKIKKTNNVCQQLKDKFWDIIVAKPIETWSVRVLNAFASGLNERAGDLLNMLQSKEYKLDINDEKQTIQGVYVSDKAMYLELRGVIVASHLEG